MAIAFDAATGSTYVIATSQTFAHTCSAGDNRLLVVGIMGDNSGSNKVTGVTYAGVAMTLVGKIFASGARYNYLFYLLSPASGTNNVVITAEGAADVIGGYAASYTGVKQSAQPDASITQITAITATTLTTSVTTVADNCWAIISEDGYSNGTVPGAGTGSTFRAAETTAGGGGLFDSNAALTPAGSKSMTTTRSADVQKISHVMASFSPAVATVGVPRQDGSALGIGGTRLYGLTRIAP